jgi:predicted lipoprotein with Yx(FWY)xxD motif
VTTLNARFARRALAPACLAAAALALSACGSDQPSSSSGSQANGAVATRDLPGVGTVLVDNAGKTVYFTDSDQAGNIKCVEDCLQLWHPVAAPGQIPQNAPVANLGTVARPDGTSQLAYQSKPLYTFSLDSQDKPASGHNANDSFGGVDFTWHAVIVSASDQPPSNDGGYGGGGY